MRGGDSDWVALTTRSTAGWPWPEESFGLDAMYGVDGWCRSCGTPLHAQSGPLTIQGRGFPSSAIWMPNWQFDVVCVDAEVAASLTEFRVATRPVHRPRGGATGVQQLLPRLGQASWYSEADLRRAVLARHHQLEGDRIGSTCDACGRWRWLPVAEAEVSPELTVLPADADLAASPEIFGDGWTTFRHLLFRRELAEHLVSANPTTWSVAELPTGRSGDV